MSLVSEYGLDAPARTLPLLALALEDRNGKRKMNILHLQKVIRYFGYLAQKNEIEFSNFNLGAVSYELQENVDALGEFGLVEQTDRYALQLSSLGEKASKELRATLPKNDLEKLSFAKKQLNDLPDDELMFFMYYLLPETRENSTEFKRLEKKKVILTRNLFKKGRINSVTAAKWLGVTEAQFLASIQQIS